MKEPKKFQIQYLGLLINSLYAVGHCVIGFWAHSWWFLTVGAYYAVLSSARFCVMNTARKTPDDSDAASFVKRTTGILLIALSFCLIGINILSAVKERGTHFHEIVMIAIAAYSFTKIVLAIIGMTKAKQCASLFVRTLRNISFADSGVSIYSLQRSMLVSFPGMQPNDVLLFNILTGTAVWIAVLLLGINLLGGKFVIMAKSRIVKVGSKIAEAVTDGYKKMEQGVVDGYQKMEQHIVNGYTKIEDKFVDAFLTCEGESVEEAKARFKKDNQ